MNHIGDILSCRIKFSKILESIQVVMVVFSQDLVKRFLENGEINGHSELIQVFLPDIKFHAVVMAVQILALALVTAQVVGGRKLAFDY
jgi:hypothetical protein